MLTALDNGRVTTLADEVLPRIRTQRDLHRLRAANEHGTQMHEAIDILEAALGDDDPTVVLGVTQKAIASAMTIIMRADDSSGIIGDACRRLLRLHPLAAEQGAPPPRKLVDWMMKFQFHNKCDFFELDVVAYAPALGDNGIAMYRRELAAVEATLDEPPSGVDSLYSGYRREEFVLQWNAQRLAVLDRDVEAVIATHARDQQRAAWLEDTALALAEIGATEQALDWARRGADFDNGHQAESAANVWCALLAEHRPDEALDARLSVVRRWATAVEADRVYVQAGDRWPDVEDDVMAALARDPEELVTFAMRSLRDVQLAWDLAATNDIDDDRLWSDLAALYGKIDPIATVPVHKRLVRNTLVATKPAAYRRAAKRLKNLRKLVAGTEIADDVDTFIATVRAENRQRPKLREEFDRAGLP